MIKIVQCESFQIPLVGKDWKKCETTKIGYAKSFWTTLVGKDWKKVKNNPNWVF